MADQATDFVRDAGRNSSPFDHAAALGGLAVTVQGDGPGTLWLHGYTLDKSTWATMWSLLPGGRQVAVDLPGHGASPDIESGADLQSLGRRLADFCVQAEITKLVAISIGSVVGLQALIERPEHFEAAVLGAPTIAGGPFDEDIAAAYRRLGALKHMVGPGPAMTDAWLATRPWEGLDSRPGLREQVTALVNQHAWSEMKRGAFKQFGYPFQTAEQMAKVQTPTLVVIGEHELASARETADLLVEQLPAGELRELSGLHHLAFLEAPERVAELIGPHLRAGLGG